MIYAHFQIDPIKSSISIIIKFKESNESSVAPILTDIINDTDVLTLVYLNNDGVCESLGLLTPLYITFEHIVGAKPKKLRMPHTCILHWYTMHTSVKCTTLINGRYFFPPPYNEDHTPTEPYSLPYYIKS